MITNPKTGLERRLNNQDIPPYPWNNIDFLKNLNFFYTEEFPKIYKNNLFFIETTTKSPEKVISCIRQRMTCPSKITILENTQEVDNEIENKILQYAKKEKLGNPYTNAIKILGVPTVYFRQYALQLQNGDAIYLDTNQLSKLLNTSASI